MSLSIEMKKSDTGKIREDQWKQRVYKYTGSHAEAFTNSIVTFQIRLCFLSAKAKYRKWIFINTSYGSISESPVAIEILLETLSVSAIHPDQRASKWVYFLLNCWLNPTVLQCKPNRNCSKKGPHTSPALILGMCWRHQEKAEDVWAPPLQGCLRGCE